jgi:hypothetical protein
LRPHEWLCPADTDKNEPAGAVDCREEFRPQHAIAWSVFTAHACSDPADTAKKVPAGGDA